MQRIGGERIFAATDLVRFLACQHVTTMDLIHLETPMEKAEDDASAKLIQKLGHEHESSYLAALKAKGNLRICDIPTNISVEERCRLTREAMQRGEDIIYQAAFMDGKWLGYADFLRRVAQPTTLGSHGYEAVDTKLARTEKPEYVIQLAMYSDQIGAIQGVTPTLMHIVLGDGREVSLRVSDFQHYFRRAKSRFEKFVGGKKSETTGEPCSHCKYCSWRDICAEEWERSDHLSLVANITKNQIKKLRASGINSVAALAKVPAGSRIPKLSDELLQKLRAQANLHVSARATGQRVHELIEYDPGRGFDRLPQPSAGDIYFDIEGDPLYPEKLEYLFGCYFFDDGREQFLPFWAHSHEEEKDAIVKLVTFFTQRLSRFPDAHIYHYADYEVSALKRLTARCAAGEHELDQLLRRRRFVDLYKVVREGIRVSEPNYSIKNIEKFYMPARETEVAAGADSIVAYERFRQTGDQRELEAIWDYNRDDLKSTHLLQKWLLGIRPGKAIWFSGDGAAIDQAKLDKHAATEAERQQFTNRLLGGAGVSNGNILRRLTSDLVDFHRRADKPVWWSIFDKADWETDELVDDAESLGGLDGSTAGAPVPVARSLLFTYRFPKQDTKLEVGDQCRIAVTSEYAGTIERLDQDDGIVVLKRGQAKGPLPPVLSLIRNGPIENKDAPAAIKRFAESLIAGRRRYSAVETLLERRNPSIRAHASGQDIIAPNEDLIDQATRAIANLDNSCLFVQGPPGAGKTTTSAKVIVALIKAGSSIGVASNSHKAINNLLREIEVEAKKAGVSFRGLKKSSEDKPDSMLNGTLIRDVFEYPDPGTFQLLGGTSWVFSKEKYDQCLDYLFIDEAGQVAVANVVAMGLSARNLVLIGDQMQLGQPIQGVHPGESGLSVLDFFLRNQSTIPGDRGIFLPTTWRLNPVVCSFISDAVYDSRLAAHPRTAHHRLVLKGSAHPALKPEGLVFIEVDHEGCTQKSEEEAAVIKELYDNLLRQEFTVDAGGSRPLTPEEILVVAPYNVQVNHLKTVLPAGARVGTVDKFQGQQAQVVIVSMTTSSAEDIPRNLEFLLSRNRLNVAVSRARALAILVASPRLLEVPCTNIEQMRLANTLCWANAHAAAPTQGTQ